MSVYQNHKDFKSVPRKNGGIAKNHQSTYRSVTIKFTNQLNTTRKEHGDTLKTRKQPRGEKIIQLIQLNSKNVFTYFTKLQDYLKLIHLKREPRNTSSYHPKTSMLNYLKPIDSLSRRLSNQNFKSLFKIRCWKSHNQHNNLSFKCIRFSVFSNLIVVFR